MKKIASILVLSTLLVTLFYNVLGYRMLFAFEDEQEWVVAMKKIPDSEFKVINLNASLYTFAEDSDFEFVNENIIINNKSYHIFKKRIQNNILSLYYLPNINTDLTSSEIDELVNGQLFNSNNDNKVPSKKIMKSFVKDYFIEYPESLVSTNKKEIKSISLNSLPKENLLSAHLSAFYSPPDFV
ncbi:hypothetical protein [Flavobacterium sp. N3904]|uniref:hypothetical protein n=1 Tax=Flavobacterium sp. N3904 TaxID=2986835 RepID=UPI00222580C5|nr:hypothetical protein [Flavobacterium sp. N3904]